MGRIILLYSKIKPEIFGNSGEDDLIIVQVDYQRRYFGIMSSKGAHGSDGRAPILFTFEPNYDGANYRILQIKMNQAYEDTIKVTSNGNLNFTFQLLNATDGRFGQYINLWLKCID